MQFKYINQKLNYYIFLQTTNRVNHTNSPCGLGYACLAAVENHLQYRKSHLLSKTNLDIINHT